MEQIKNETSTYFPLPHLPVITCIYTKQSNNIISIQKVVSRISI